MPRAQIDERYLDTPYYITPNDQVGQEAFAVIRDAMRGKEMVALGRVVLAKRERVIMLEPWEKGLMGTTLRYAYEVRKADDLFRRHRGHQGGRARCSSSPSISWRPSSGDFEPATFVDRYEDAVVRCCSKKQAGIAVQTEKSAEAPRNVINLMDALRKSVKEAPAPAKATEARKSASPDKRRCCFPFRARAPRVPRRKPSPAASGTAAEPRRAGKRSA